jgi:hypothetical protein
VVTTTAQSPQQNGLVPPKIIWTSYRKWGKQACARAILRSPESRWTVEVNRRSVAVKEQPALASAFEARVAVAEAEWNRLDHDVVWMQIVSESAPVSFEQWVRGVTGVLCSLVTEHGGGSETGNQARSRPLASTPHPMQGLCALDWRIAADMFVTLVCDCCTTNKQTLTVLSKWFTQLLERFLHRQSGSSPNATDADVAAAVGERSVESTYERASPDCVQAARLLVTTLVKLRERQSETETQRGQGVARQRAAVAHERRNSRRRRSSGAHARGDVAADMDTDGQAHAGM